MNRKEKDTELQEAKAKKSDDYDPYENRVVAHPTTYSETMFHLLKGSLGSGILAMPNAFKHAGYGAGIVGTALIGLLCCYCIHVLVRAQYKVCVMRKEPQMTYPNIMKYSFLEGPKCFQKMSPHIGVIVNIFILCFQLGCSSVYVVFISSNIKHCFDYYFNINLDVRIYACIVTLPLILINYIRSLKLLAPFSMIANLITLITFGIIWYFLLRDEVSFTDRAVLGDGYGIPVFFGTVLFALEAIGIMLPLENEMKNPKYFTHPFGILNVGFFVITTLYILMGLFGYMKYGDNILGSVTLNLPTEEPLAQSVKLLLALAIYVTHGLATFVATDLIWKDYIVEKLKPEAPALLYEYLLRTAMVLFTVLMAVLIPNLGLFISLVGALCLATLGIAFPAIIDILLSYKESSGCSLAWLYISNILLVLVGFLGLIIGILLPIFEFYDEERKKK